MKKTAVLFLSSLLIAPHALAQDAYPTYATGGAYVSQSSSANANVGYETRISGLEDQLRALTGKTEQLEFALRRMDQTLARIQSDYEQRLAKLETAPPPAPVAQAQPSSPEIVDTNGQLGDLKMQNGRVTGGTNSPKASPLPNKPEDYGLTADELYDKALGLLRQASYDEAERAFKNFIAKYPKDKQIENARYWFGETFYVRAKFSDAAVAFADSYQQNPKGVKAPDSLLKLGMSLSALGKTEDACATYGSLKKDFPKAPVTLRTRVDQERIRLKCK
jgi:tol-pal system protein YbgF